MNNLPYAIKSPLRCATLIPVSRVYPPAVIRRLPFVPYAHHSWRMKSFSVPSDMKASADVYRPFSVGSMRFSVVCSEVGVSLDNLVDVVGVCRHWVFHTHICERYNQIIEHLPFGCLLVIFMSSPWKGLQGLILNPTFFGPTRLTTASKTSNPNLVRFSTLPRYTSVRVLLTSCKNWSTRYPFAPWISTPSNPALWTALSAACA